MPTPPDSQSSTAPGDELGPIREDGSISVRRFMAQLDEEQRTKMPPTMRDRLP